MRYRERIDALWRGPFLAWRLFVQGRYDFTYDQIPITVRRMSWGKRFNLLKSGFNLLHRRTRPWSKPLHMQFELTSFCNLRCPVCPTGTFQLERNAKYLDPELFRAVWDEVGPNLLTASLWGWGESIYHPQLGEILRTAGEHGVVTFLSTNGQHLGRTKITRAILDRPPSQLIVAIDGLTDETNSKFRVGATLGPILEAVRNLAEEKKRRGQELPVLHMRFMVMEHNEHEVPGVEVFARENGFDMFTLRTLSIIDSEETHAAHDALKPKSQDFRAYEYDQGERIRKSDYVCMQPFWFPSLFADGRLVGCEQDFNASKASGVVGVDGSFTDLWESEAAARMRKTVRDSPMYNSFCRNCPAWDRDLTDTSVSATFLNPELSVPLRVGGNDND